MMKRLAISDNQFVVQCNLCLPSVTNTNFCRQFPIKQKYYFPFSSLFLAQGTYSECAICHRKTSVPPSICYAIFSGFDVIPLHDCALRVRLSSLLHAPCELPLATVSSRQLLLLFGNSLPESVRASPSLPVFRSRLKTELFARSYNCSDQYDQHYVH